MHNNPYAGLKDEEPQPMSVSSLPWLAPEDLSSHLHWMRLKDGMGR